MERRQEKKRKVWGAEVRNHKDKEWTVAGIECTPTRAHEGRRLRLVGATSHKTMVLPGKECESEDEEREVNNLDVDMLAELFSHLSQKERCEVMLVCKQWKIAAGESKKWKKVDMLWKRSWLTGGMMLTVLRVAQEIRIRPGCDDDQITVSDFSAGRE